MNPRSNRRPRWSTLFATLCLATLLGPSQTCRAAREAPRPDNTGMIPGDIVFGNLNTYPGHVGIYVGKWKLLPKDLKDKYKHVFDNVLIRSRDRGLKYSYLVVDSDGGRGCRLASFVEQFTGYLPKGARGPKLPSSLKWESSKGGAVRWTGLPDSSPKRWAILEEALKAAAARVPYEGNHYQLETTRFGGNEYSKMKGLDCIALVHVAYWRGAEIDLDVSFWPWHDPKQLFAEASKRGLFRKTKLKPVFMDAAIRGRWSVSLRTVKSGSDFKINFDGAVYISRVKDQLRITLIDPQSLKRIDGKEPVEIPVKLVVSSGELQILPKNQQDVGAGVNRFDFRVKSDGSLAAVVAGVDDDGDFELRLTGTKIRTRVK